VLGGYTREIYRGNIPGNIYPGLALFSWSDAHKAEPYQSRDKKIMDKFFKISEQGSTIRTEMQAGLSTFLTMAFIVAVNPAILSDSGIDFGAAFVATIIATVFGTLIMGLWAGWPVAVAPGMGLNAFFTYVVVFGYGFTWQQALAAVFVSSVIFFIFSASRLRGWLIRSIPKALQIGITAGIGLFLAIIGLTGAGIIVDNPDTLIGLGDLTTAPVWLAIIGLILMAGLEHRGIKGGILIAILAISILGWSTTPDSFGGIISAPPEASALFQMDFSAILTPAFLSVVFVMFFVDFFDTTGTLTAIAGPAGKRNADGSVEGLDKATLADTSASIVGAAVGTSNMTTYLESAAGLRAGGRTGLTAVIVAVLFLSCLFFEPLFASIPAYATAPALIFVASSFMSGLRDIDWDDVSQALPVLVTVILMPLTFSIAAGIAFGFFCYVGCKMLAGKTSDLTSGVWVITGFAALWLMLTVWG